MTHDPESAAAAYLAGEHPDRQEFEAHLLDCDNCWGEVAQGRRGRDLAESARELAPAALRESIRAAVAAEPRRRSRWPRVAAAAVAVAAVLAGTVAVWPRQVPQPQPSAIAAAVDGYRAGQLPGRQIPVRAAPDLAQVALSPVGAGAGQVGGVPVTAYAYRDTAGRRLLVYVSEQPFPTARGARQLVGPDGPWVVDTQGVTVLCARQPHALLVLGDDPQLVRQAAVALDVV